MERDAAGNIICPHNWEVRCQVAKCEKCGWNPEVAARRLLKLKEELYISDALTFKWKGGGKRE
jgi:hypothetical protein